jgi:hypothetical protein
MRLAHEYFRAWQAWLRPSANSGMLGGHALMKLAEEHGSTEHGLTEHGLPEHGLTEYGSKSREWSDD